jgi:GntR family transcriptional repressor for pyruvate dehydrogenase complex
MNASRKELIQRLLDLISTGNIVKDDKLPPERELTSLLDTTRPLLREALISLDALGILDIRDRQGIFLAGKEERENLRALGRVQVWPMELLSQVMEIRQILDPGATALAALRRQEEDLAKMDACISKLEGFHAGHDPDEASLGAYWNTMLHATIFKATGNSLLARLYESLLEMSEKGISAMRMGVLTSSEPEKTELIIAQHRELVESIRVQDMERARTASKIHLKHTIDTLVELGLVNPNSNFFTQSMDRVLM